MIQSFLTLLGEGFEFLLIGSFQLIPALSESLGSYWNLSTFGQTILFLSAYILLFLIFQVSRNRINFRSEQEHSFQPLGNRRLSLLAGIGVSTQLFAILNLFVTKNEIAFATIVLFYAVFIAITFFYFWRQTGRQLAVYSIIWLLGFIQLFSMAIYLMILYFYAVEVRKQEKNPKP